MKIEHLIELLAPLYVPLGACRLMQLVMVDKLFAPVRALWDWLFNRQHRKIGDPELGYLGYLIQCPWCMSMWVGLAIVLGLVNTRTRHPVLWLLIALTVSLLAVIIDRSIDRWWPDEAHALPGPPAAPTTGTFIPPAEPAPPPPAAIVTAFEDAHSGNAPSIPGV